MILILLFMNRRDSIVALLIWSLSKTWRIKHYETSTSDIKRSRHDVFQQFSTWICCYQPRDPRPPGRCVWGRGRGYLNRTVIRLIRQLASHSNWIWLEIFPGSDPFLFSKPRQIKGILQIIFQWWTWTVWTQLGPPHTSSLMTFIAATYYLVISQLFDIYQHFLSSS